MPHLFFGRNTTMLELQWKMSSKIGDIYLIAHERALVGLYFFEKPIPFAKSLKEVPLLKSVIEQLEEYLEGKRTKFSIPLEPEGTEFQKEVWKTLQKIPYGKTRSYQEMANLIKNEKACRAVGTANGKNPISIIIPCHRVITTSGTLGGYSGGLDKKIKLLEIEKVSIKN